MELSFDKIMDEEILKISEEELRGTLVAMLLRSAEESQRAFQETRHLRLLRDSIDYGLAVLAKQPENPQAISILVEGIPEYLRRGGSKKNERFRNYIAARDDTLHVSQT